MTEKKAIRRLHGCYRRFGVSREQIEKLYDDGIQNGLSPQIACNWVRFVLGMEFRQQEYFSSKEITEMLDQSEDEVKKQLADAEVGQWLLPM